MESNRFTNSIPGAGQNVAPGTRKNRRNRTRNSNINMDLDANLNSAMDVDTDRDRIVTTYNDDDNK